MELRPAIRPTSSLPTVQDARPDCMLHVIPFWRAGFPSLKWLNWSHYGNIDHVAHFKPLRASREYVVVGCVHIDFGRSGGVACHVGLRRDAWVVGARIVPPSHPPRHCRGHLYMRHYALPSRCPNGRMERSGELSRFASPALTQACPPVFKRSRISVSSFSSPDGPAGAGAGGLLNRFTCLMTTNRQKAIIRNSMTVLMNMP
jgi:hypothetical protein